MWRYLFLKGVNSDALTTGIATITPLWVKSALLAIIPSGFVIHLLNKSRYAGLSASDPVPPLSINVVLSMVGYSAFFTYLAVWYYRSRSSNNDPY